MTINEMEREARRGVEMEIPQAQDMLNLIADWRGMRKLLSDIANGSGAFGKRGYSGASHLALQAICKLQCKE